MTQANYVTMAFVALFEENHETMMEINRRVRNLSDELFNVCISHSLPVYARCIAHANREVVDIFFTAEEYDAICAFAENPKPEQDEHIWELLNLIIEREARMEGNETKELKMFLNTWFLSLEYAYCVAIDADSRLHMYFIDLLPKIRGFLQVN